MQIIPKIQRLFYGGDYNPEQWSREIWVEDMRLMRDARVNLVSLGVFSWSWLQPEPGRFDFIWLDEVLDLLHSHGISVNLSTATATPPPWLVQLHPEILPVNSSGLVLGATSRQHYAPWSSVYRRYAAALVRKIATRYALHPALVSWHINNEYSCHVRESFDPETVGHWRMWLEQRHGNIQTLNEAWNTAFWGQRYRNFSEITAPRVAPTFRNPGMMLDWRRFSAEAFLTLVLMEKAILREITPEIPVSTNYVGWVDLPGLNQQTIASELDYVSWDSYPDPALGLDAVQFNALCHDFMRSLKPGHPHILMEQATSAVNWRSFNQPRRPEVTRTFSHQAVARGADGVMFFQWRQSAAGAEQFHSGMVPITGQQIGNHENRTWTLTKQLGRELAALESISGSTIQAKVALLVDLESLWALEHEAKPIKFDTRAELSRLHRPLWKRNIPVDLRHPDDDLSGYKLLIAPALMLLSPASANRLRHFVAQGGTLLFTPFCSVTNGETRIYSEGIPGGLTDVFGYIVEEWWPVAPEYRGRITGALGEMSWAGFSELGHATTAHTIAVFEDDWCAGRPALTCNSYIKGRAWYLAAQLDPVATDVVFSKMLNETGIQGVAETPEGVEATLRIKEGIRVLHLVNHTSVPAKVILPFAGTELIKNERVNDFLLIEPFEVAAVVEN